MLFAIVTLTHALVDANLFHHLETWVESATEPSTTEYLSDIQLFQRHIATCAFKLAGGIDLSSSTSSSRLVKQYPVPSEFVAKITKAFLDTLYAFLDGLVHLASDELHPTAQVIPTVRDAPTSGAAPVPNSFEQLNLADAVSLV